MRALSKSILLAGYLVALALLVSLPAMDALSEVQPDEPVLAVVGGEPIDAHAFRSRYVDHLVRSGQPDTPQRRRLVLDGMIDVELVARTMREAGIEDDETYRRELEMTRRRLLLDAYREQAVFDTVDVTDGDLREMFVRMNTEWRARHLYARTRDRADSLYERLQNGATFQELARNVFADSALSQNGGDVGYFGFDEMDPAFEDAARALEVGEISRPVRTAYGYSIIQLVDQRRKQVLTEAAFERKRDEVRAYALRRAGIEAKYQASRQLAEELAPVFDPETFAALYGHLVDGTLVPEGDAAEAWLQRPLVTFGAPSSRDTWTVSDFYREARYTTEEQQAAVRRREQLEAYVVGLVVRTALLRRAYEVGLDARADYRQAVESAMDVWLYERARERVRKAVELGEATLRTHYRMHRDQYWMPERVRVREILVETKTQAEAVKARLEATSFDVLARRYSLRPGAGATGGDVGYVSRPQLGRLAEHAFAAGQGDVVGPLEVAGRYVLLQVGDRKPRRIKTFEEAQVEVAREVREAQATTAFQEHVHQLRQRYDVSVDEERLAALRLPR